MPTDLLTADAEPIPDPTDLFSLTTYHDTGAALLMAGAWNFTTAWLVECAYG